MVQTADAMPLLCIFRCAYVSACLLHHTSRICVSPRQHSRHNDSSEAFPWSGSLERPVGLMGRHTAHLPDAVDCCWQQLHQRPALAAFASAP